MLQQQTYSHHEPMTGLADTAKSGRRSGMLDDIVQLLSQQFAASHAACQSALAENLGMPLADLKALELVMAFDALPTGHLARLMGISSGGATALINRLEAAGYVERGRHPLDRRVIVIRPVESQCRTIAKERQWIADAIATTSCGYDTAELDTVHAFLTRCGRGVKRDALEWLEMGGAHHPGHHCTHHAE
ncbi:MarR family transcriptional regulator [Achromobacter xylosoxidans]|uniref:MarR family winged helix-turn-helix transcriptional regulator n=1 Tax=Achromobacter sp. JD417 TaxID=2893881 RepID=UPI00079B3F2D|nr:MarR family transcriptional regulator [Achromobacter xylosoxidans]